VDLAGGGIGRACAVLLAKEGAAAVAIADLDIAAAKDALNECQTMATNPRFQGSSFSIDVTKEDSVRSLFSDVTRVFGRLDYCVNCAGVSENALAGCAY
jgi:NAD(P)-dependent dehydrogenase (short-subunit alcohol dehydrogenase family)